jgi:hypothetical protein
VRARHRFAVKSPVQAKLLPPIVLATKATARAEFRLPSTPEEPLPTYSGSRSSPATCPRNRKCDGPAAPLRDTGRAGSG